MPFVAPLLVVVVAAFVSPPTALWVGGALVMVSVARLASGFRLDGVLQRAAERIAKVVGALLASAVYVVIFVPAWAFRWVSGSGGQPSGWLRRDPDQFGSPTRTFGHEPPVAGSRRSRFWRIVGVVTALAILNYLVGDVWDRLAPQSAAQAIGGSAERNLINLSGRKPPPDPRANDPAMGGVPWASEYFNELNSIQATYWPFVLYRDKGYRGKYVNGSGWTRDSYEPTVAAGVRIPSISFYGGSTTFGVGQRDDYTIPSQVARLAEAAGYPIRVTNHGMPGYVSWDEMQLFEHFSNAGERPLRAVFYDGTNDVYAQRQPAVIGNPTETEVDSIGQRLSGVPTAGNGAARVPDASSDVSDIWGLYLQHSAVNRVGRWLGHLFSSPAGAETKAATPTAAQIGTAAVQVYDRSRDLIEHIGHKYSVRQTFFWQPIPDWNNPARPYRTAVGLLTAPTLSIVSCLDGHQDVYLADSHTNEDGARIVAGCMWKVLEPVVERWYASHHVDRQPRAPVGGGPIAAAAGQVSLPLTASTLGTGWTATASTSTASTPAFRVAGGCVAATKAGGQVSERNGPGLELDGAVVRGRLTTTVIDAASATAAANVARGLESSTGLSCIESHARESFGFSADAPFDWPHSVPQHTADGLVWSASGTNVTAHVELTFFIGLARRGARLIAVELASTDAARAQAWGTAALHAVAGA